MNSCESKYGFYRMPYRFQVIVGNKGNDLLKARPHVSVFVWKRNFFFAHCLPVHSYPANMVTFRQYSNLSDYFTSISTLPTQHSIFISIFTPFLFHSFQKRLCVMADGRITFPWTFFKPNSASWDQHSFAECSSLVLSLQISKAGLKRLDRGWRDTRPRRFWIRPGRTSGWWDNFAAKVGC